jgi:phosphoglycerate kinase
VETFLKVIENPQRPLVVIVGGVKIETKLPLLSKMHRFADYVLVGGKIARETRTLLKVQHEKAGHKGAHLIADLIEDGTDITELSAENFVQIISLAKTVIWNGPMGVTRPISNFKFKISNSQEADESSSLKIARGIIESKAYSVVGGGDTVGFLKEHGLLEKFSFFSTGGGAMLAFLSGEKLPGLEALTA